MTTPTLPQPPVRRCHHALNLFHAAVYFSPETAKELAALGIEDGHAAYLAARSAPMGAVGPGPVTAAFNNFNPALIARHLPAVWESAPPQEVTAARLRAAEATVRRLLGDAVVASDDMAEAAGLALRATEGCTRHARPLYAAHADVPLPDEPAHLRYWWAATLLREHRGDAHVAALLHAGLDPLEAMVTHTAAGSGVSPRWALGIRGWGRADWDAAGARLKDRGLLDAEGGLTDSGRALREEVEAHTDRMDAAPYALLGEDGVARLTKLAMNFLAAAVAAGAFPGEVGARD
ncbi:MULTISPECIES: hypothetical protein [unclassified Streptomyces]|uniref:SCO6745 family protein n=1 Tax=unclassified Streptomyces TaxID=2593676 RepID=UPI0008DDB3DA|nr:MULTISPECIES: hypothetical protein [unclassified Streptomyces]OII70042.1 hypothetical protein BJP39_15185 [Streptomyces sp. CC77]